MSWKNWALLNQTNTKVDSDNKRIKNTYLCWRKSSSEGPFLYISFRFAYKVSSYCYSVFLLISRSPSPIASSFLYTLFPFHLFPPHACQIVGIDTCPISPSHKSLCSSCKVENYCSGITSKLIDRKSVV